MDITQSTISGAEFDPSPWLPDERHQKMFWGLVRGLSQHKAASEAGYSGTYDNLRSRGSKLANMARMKVAVDAYRVWQGQSSESPLTDREVELEIARSVRSPSGPSEKVQALKLHLDRRERRQQEQAERETNPFLLLRRLVVAGASIGDRWIAEMVVHWGFSPAALLCEQDCMLKATPSIVGDAEGRPACLCPQIRGKELTDELVGEYSRVFAKIRAASPGDGKSGSTPKRPDGSGGVAVVATPDRDRGESEETPRSDGSRAAGTNKPPLRDDALAARLQHAFGKK